MLEELCAQNFEGIVTLESSAECIELGLSEGRVCHARSNDVEASFPAFLITRGIFSSEKVRTYLEMCKRADISLEALLLRRKKVGSAGLRFLCADLGHMVLSRAMGITAEVSVKEVTMAVGTVDTVTVLRLDPIDAFFHVASKQPVHDVMVDVLRPYWERPLRRAPNFFQLHGVMRRHFGETSVPMKTSNAVTLKCLEQELGHHEDVVAQAFAMHLTGMTCFSGEGPVRLRLLETLRVHPREASESGVSVGALRAGEEASPRPHEVDALGVTQNTRTWGPGQGTGEEVPLTPGDLGDPLSLSGDSASWGSNTFIPGGVIAGTNDARPQDALPPLSQEGSHPGSETSNAPSQGQMTSIDMPTSASPTATSGEGGGPSEHSVRSVIEEQLIRKAADGMRINASEYLGLKPHACFSRVRAVYRRACLRYAEGAYRDYPLSDAARAARLEILSALHAAYETLTDLNRRVAHDQDHRVSGPSPSTLRVWFEAEGIFKAAQIRMTQGDHETATELLRQAVELNTYEPEYLSYLAWSLYCSGVLTRAEGAEVENPEDLLTQALHMDDLLESAWVFQARVYEATEQKEAALDAFKHVLRSNLANDEACAAVARLEPEVERTSQRSARASFASRMTRVLGRSSS